MIKNQKSKSNFYSTNTNFLSQQYLSTNATDTMVKKPKIEPNITNFISQKNKFYFSNFFNENESKKFLESRDIALKRIIFNDEIENINNTNEITNMNCKLPKMENKNEKKSKQHTNKGNIVSPKKKRSKNKDDKNKILNENKNDDKTSNGEINNLKIINTKNNCHNDSEDNYIYKFIIDHADESEDNFHKKLKKEIKAAETQKNYISNKNTYNSRRTQISNKKNDKNSIKINMSEKSEKKINPFKYSEVIKNLMVGNKIEVSSINDDTPKSPIRNQTKEFKTLEDKKDDTNKNLNDKNDSNSQISINSSHESLMSILSDLI
jgi:hypothetical protein